MSVRRSCTPFENLDVLLINYCGVSVAAQKIITIKDLIAKNERRKEEEHIVHDLVTNKFRRNNIELKGLQNVLKNTVQNKKEELYNDRMEKLLNLWTVTYETVEQALKALRFCETTKKIAFSDLHIESARSLLLSTCKRDAIIQTIVNINCNNIFEYEYHNFGNVLLAHLFFPGGDNEKKKKFTTWYVAVVSHGIDVYATVAKTANADGHVVFDEKFEIKRLSSDFEINVALYGMKIPNNKKDKNSSGQSRSFSLYEKTTLRVSDIEKNDFSMCRLSQECKMYGHLNASVRARLDPHPLRRYEKVPAFWMNRQ